MRHCAFTEGTEETTLASAINFVNFVSFRFGFTLNLFYCFIWFLLYLDMCAAVVNVFLLCMSVLQDVVIVSVREDTAWRCLFSLFFVNSKNVILLIFYYTIYTIFHVLLLLEINKQLTRDIQRELQFKILQNKLLCILLSDVKTTRMSKGDVL